jgi:hypothetical protein
MNSAHGVTVHWLPELAPSIEGRDAALELYTNQTNGGPPPTFYENAALGVWGYLGAEALLLFKVPPEWTP